VPNARKQCDEPTDPCARFPRVPLGTKLTQRVMQTEGRAT